MRLALPQIDINSRDRFVFMHIPKTAGITVRTILGAKLSGLRLFPEIIEEKLTPIPVKKLKQYQLFMGHFPYWRMDYLFPDGFLGITFLRDPFQRTVSHYQYLVRQETFGPYPEVNKELSQIRKMTIDDFFSPNDFVLIKLARNLQTRQLGMMVPVTLLYRLIVNKITAFQRKPPVDFEFNEVIDVQKRPRNLTSINLIVAQLRLRKMPFFGIAERFQESLNLLCFTFGWRPILDDIKLNQSPGQRGPLSLQTQSAIREMNILDNELYTYAIRVFEERYRAMLDYLFRNYSENKDASLDSAVDQNAVSKLLEKHYETRRNKRHSLRPVLKEYYYFITSPVEGSFGWYSAEEAGLHGFARWSGPGTESGFDIPCPQGDLLEITFRVLQALSPEIIDGLTLFVDNQLCSLEYLFVDSTYIFRTVIKNPSHAPFVRMLFKIPNTIVPSEVNWQNQDKRSLGFLLNWIKVKPITENQFLPGEKSSFGWYAAEDLGIHGYARWSGPGTESGFNILRTPGNEYEVCFRVLTAVRPEVINMLALSINNRTINLERAQDASSAYIFKGLIKIDETQDEVLNLRFVVPFVTKPSEIDSSLHDERPVGILLNWISITSAYQ